MKNLENQKRWILQEKYDGKLTKAAQKDIARLEAGEPVDYIIGWVDFLGCRIDLFKKTLIPRAETEFWTQKAIEELYSNSSTYGKKSINVLDMFAGSGAIGIAILKHIKNAHVAFIDSEKNCVDQIRINCKLNKIPKNKYTVIHSALFTKVRTGSELVQFDVIVANPPYIPTKNKHKVQKSALLHEPHAAMFGGGDGLFFICQFLARAQEFLTSGGIIYMEFDPPQKPAITKLLKKYGYKSWHFHRDQFDKWRWVSAVG